MDTDFSKVAVTRSTEAAAAAAAAGSSSDR